LGGLLFKWAQSTHPTHIGTIGIVRSSRGMQALPSPLVFILANIGTKYNPSGRIQVLYPYNT